MEYGQDNSMQQHTTNSIDDWTSMTGIGQQILPFIGYDPLVAQFGKRLIGSAMYSNLCLFATDPQYLTQTTWC